MLRILIEYPVDFYHLAYDLGNQLRMDGFSVELGGAALAPFDHAIILVFAAFRKVVSARVAHRVWYILVSEYPGADKFNVDFSTPTRRKENYPKLLTLLRSSGPTESSAIEQVAAPGVPKDIGAETGVGSVGKPAAPPKPAALESSSLADLIDSLRSGGCVLLEGPELTALSNHPITRTNSCRRILEWASSIQLIDRADAERLEAELEAGMVSLVMDFLVDASRARYADLLSLLATEFPPSKQEIPSVYSLLARLPFSGVIGTSFGDTLDRAFGGHLDNRAVATALDTAALVGCLSNQEFFVLKPYGRLDRPESISLSEAQFNDEIIYENLAFAHFLESLFVSRSIVFVGFTLDQVDETFRAFRIRSKPMRKHYAIAPVGKAWTTKASLLHSRFGLEILDYPEDDASALVSLLTHLEIQLGPTTVIRRRQTNPIQRILLENIGPFESLDLKLDPSWNLFLGNNGVGKSTILRAVALALCGRDAEQYASRIMRTGATTSSIVIQTATATYRTLLQRTATSIEVSSSPNRPLEPEGWLALAFPPLRAGTGGSGKASESADQSLISDILPILRGEADSRLDNLRGWIVNLDHRIARAKHNVISNCV